MRRQTFLLLTALLITTEIVADNLTANAQQRAVELTSERNSPAISAHLTHVASKNTPLELAYQDAISILSKNNSCSRFFRGPRAEGVLSRLVTQFQIHVLRDSTTGIEMSGSFTYFAQPEKRAGYRLFAEATINTRGPFFKAKVFPSEPYVPRVGSFEPNTREVRVLILLHELGHLMEGHDGNWLIPDDGNAPGLSARNTELIETQCRAQILSLSEVATNQIVSN
jgi:hypothetical protein